MNASHAYIFLAPPLYGHWVSVSVVTLRRGVPLVTCRLAVLQVHGVHPAASSVAVGSSQPLVLPWVGRDASTFPVISLL